MLHVTLRLVHLGALQLTGELPGDGREALPLVGAWLSAALLALPLPSAVLADVAAAALLARVLPAAVLAEGAAAALLALVLPATVLAGGPTAAALLALLLPSAVLADGAAAALLALVLPATVLADGAAAALLAPALLSAVPADAVHDETSCYFRGQTAKRVTAPPLKHPAVSFCSVLNH